MAWRDRTNLFISYRASTPHHPSKRPRFNAPNGFGDEERQGLISSFDDHGTGDAVIEMDTLPPRWLDLQDQVSDFLSSIAEKSKRLEALHARHVLPGFDDEEVKKREEREIEKLTQEITRAFQGCQRAIRRIDGMVREEARRPGGLAQGEETMARNLRIALATRVGEVSTGFRKKQAAYLKKLRQINGVPSSPNLKPLPSNPYNDPSLAEASYEASSDASFSRSALQHAQQSLKHRPQNTNEALIASREREIESIATGVIELASIFQELNTMVIDQGSMLDRIDYNVENTLVQVKEADKELKVATGYQRKSVKRKIILLLLIIVAGMFILLGLKLGRKRGSSVGDLGRHVVGTDAEAEDGAPFERLMWKRNEDVRWGKRRKRRRLWIEGVGEVLV